MVLDAVSNFVRGNTDAAIASGDTTVSVVDASIFPDPATDGEFNVVIWNASNFPRPDQDANVEIVRVTARDTGTNELTVTRAQETTSDVAHPDGSAIHLSPTAKMFSDIEGTFTTEAEAADAAPVQSVFGRVGTVVAETGDYAATQISNFSSEVLTSISGSTIAPSAITNLWNGTVVTADVNNTNTTTETLEAGSTSTNFHEIVGSYSEEHIATVSSSGELQIPEEYHDADYYYIKFENWSDSASGSVNTNLRLRINGDDDAVYEYIQRRGDTLTEVTGSTGFPWQTAGGTHRRKGFAFALVPVDGVSFGQIRILGGGVNRSVVEGTYDPEETVSGPITSLGFSTTSGGDLSDSNPSVSAITIR